MVWLSEWFRRADSVLEAVDKPTRIIISGLSFHNLDAHNASVVDVRFFNVIVISESTWLLAPF